MQKNMGGADIFIRALVGIAFLLNIIILETGVLGSIILFALGAAMIITAWIGYCPAYTPLGICTCTDSCCCNSKAE